MTRSSTRTFSSPRTRAGARGRELAEADWTAPAVTALPERGVLAGERILREFLRVARQGTVEPPLRGRHQGRCGFRGWPSGRVSPAAPPATARPGRRSRRTPTNARTVTTATARTIFE
ncbi:hypothetical protein SALBM311S_08575 [Streptomyces alboniger]